ncbi:MAG: carboxypeptidase-like regulatory domain-containing protein [Dehalococcoidales bacterium]|nr:carboxypeptidase-like regulatory domain-containing protein [Dehalococcoidales bacterium]
MLFLFVLLASPAQAAEGRGTIEGRVVNESTDGTGVPNQAVTLGVYLNDSQTDAREATTDAGGRFAFADLATGSGYRYDVTLNYAGADYTSDSVDFAGGFTIQSVKISVYDSTATDEAIKVVTQRAIISAQLGNLAVKQYAQIENDSKLTYIGEKEIALGKKETLRFYVPTEATDKTYGLSLMQCCVYPGDDGISDIMVVQPGSKEVAYNYRVSYKSDTYTFTQKFNYPTGRFELLVPASGGITVNGGGLAQEGTVNVQGQIFNRYSMQDAGIGQVLDVKLSGLPREAGALRFVIPGLIMMAASAGAIYLLTRRKPKPAPVMTAKHPVSARQGLLAELARLDDNFEAGCIDEDEYRSERAVIKRKLSSLATDEKARPDKKMSLG